MKKLLTIFLITVTLSAQAQVKKVLFLGNSYTYVNDLPTLIKNIALSFGDTISHDSSTPGGHTYRLHSTNGTSLAKIQAQDWDHVILQEQSQIPSLTPAIVGNDYSVPHSVTLNNLIKANNSCTETVFFMTWGRENGDASFCAQHPPVCTYAGMQQELRNTYMFMADSNKATVSPVGVAWKTMRDSFPSFQLYSADGSHPSLHGSYLAACVFYSTLYQKSSIGSTSVPVGIGAGDALTIQTVATNTVLDSLDLWRIGANWPTADFNYTVNTSNGNVDFTSTSANDVTYEWNFGDGNSSTLENPSHTYAGSINTYSVELIVYSTDSCFSDTITQTVNIAATGIENMSYKNNLTIYPNPANNFIEIKTDLKYNRISIIDVTGKTVQRINSEAKIDVSNLKSGIYFIKIINKEGSITNKFVKQ
ncbi:MAG: hypothetical protein COB15_06710 [Flavobacteriales bacterium]|nr:MAG: hypothetical protein COB15_06710 [Flavobacteriales bacterium]